MLAMMRRRPSEEAGGERSVGELSAISLFSGAGGLDLGVERAGYRITVSLDHDRDSCETLRANFPGVPVLEGDIRQFTTEAILEAGRLAPGEAALLVGGPPCTPFSKSGYWLEYKRAGRDPEASLLDHYLRVLDEARPRAFLLENVYGLAYRNHNAPWFEKLLTTCRHLGYRVAERVILAADYGVPQRRQRVFVMGSLEQEPSFPDPTHSGPHETRKGWDESLSTHVPT